MIEVHRLTKQFALSGGRELTAVNAVTFAVPSGEVYGLLGSNGAGKTTTLRMILGLLQPSAGYASIAGFRSDRYPQEVKRRVGLVSSSAGIYQWLSAREMLLFFADLYGVGRRQARDQLDRLAEQFALTEFLDQRCVTLSTGQKQRVNLARALIHNPPVVLLDEPTSGVDVLGSQAVLEYVKLLRGAGKAVILSTHRLDEAERICDRIGLITRGTLEAEGTLDELRAQTGETTLVDIFLHVARGTAGAGHEAER